MFKGLRDLLFLDVSDINEMPAPDDTNVSAAVLLVEAACSDGRFDPEEEDAIRTILARHFEMDEAEAEALLDAARGKQKNAVQLLTFTREIKNTLDETSRVAIIEMLWEVAYADGILHDYEANLVRRVAGLLYVSDRDRGDAKKRVLAKLGIAK